MDKLGAVELLDVTEEFGDRDSRELLGLVLRHACKALEGGAHVAGLGEDGVGGFAGRGLHVFRGFEQGGVAEDDGQWIVELPCDVAGELAEAGELFAVNELFEHECL